MVVYITKIVVRNTILSTYSRMTSAVSKWVVTVVLSELNYSQVRPGCDEKMIII